MADLRPPGDDERRWIHLHAREDGTDLHFEVRCRALRVDGTCRIYDKRPTLCRVFKAGGD